MAAKRRRDDDGTTARPQKRHNKGFTVGPANLPDGTHKRKVQKIKKDLIHKAKLKKQYAKLKAREESAAKPNAYDEDREDVVDEEKESKGASLLPEPSLEPHPDRMKMLEETSPNPEPQPAHNPQTDWRRKRTRPQPFRKEAEMAHKRNEELQARRKAQEQASEERARKRAEREKFQKAMAKARGVGPNGKRKLGRESSVLLQKVQRLVGK